MSDYAVVPTIPAFEDFALVARTGDWAPVPDDHALLIADIVSSTKAISEGRYKAVNMAGAAFICAAMNALGRRSLDFTFGGDGAALIVGPADVDRCRRAAAVTAGWVLREFGLEMRVALVAIAAARAAGTDVRLARFRASPNATYAMLAGGGLEWAEQAMKAGRYRIEPDHQGAIPDLAGLSCRWQPFRSRRGLILSLIVVPRPGADRVRVERAIARVIDRVSSVEDAGSPLPDRDPPYRPSLTGLGLEARGAGSLPARLARRIRVLTLMAASYVAFNSGRRLGPFDPVRYWAIATRNSDYRKYADGLRMTIDCSGAAADEIEAMLAEAEQDGLVVAGLHRQSAAQMTCIVPSPLQDDHVHFVDGAGGGYAAAAHRLRERSRR